jgi:translocation and assembly module TamB
MTATGRGRARRRWRLIALAVLLIGAGLIAALPWVLELPAVQRRLAAEGSRILAPSSVAFSAMRFSWVRPTEISGLVLHDAQGDQIVTAPRAVFHWNLREILFGRPKIATLALHQADLDIERRQDGTVDLYDTLRPVISDHPEIRLVIRIDNGRLRFRDPSFPDPVIADQADIDLDLGRGSQPISWNIRLAQAKTGPESPRLNIDGSFSRADNDSAGNHDITLGLKGTRWPWTLAGLAVEARGDFTGTIDARRRSGRLLLSGDSVITDFVAIGKPLSSDTLHLDKVRAAWKVGGGDGAWTIEQLELTTPLGSLKGAGPLPTRPDQGAWLEGTFNLAALARQLPSTLHLRDGLRVDEGMARVNADLSSDPEGKTQVANVTAKVSDLVARQGQKTLTLRDPATVIAKVRLRQNELQLQRLEVQTPYLNVSGQGDFDRGIAVSATLDLAAFRARLQDWIDLGTVELAGTGKLDGHYRREGGRYRASAIASFRELRVGGLPLGQTLERNEVSLNAEASGSAAPAGWPADWRVLSLQARSGPSDFNIRALTDATGGPVTLDGHIQTQWESGGSRQQFEGNLKAKWDERACTAEQISLVLVPVIEPGSVIGAGDAIRWSGRGRYDSSTDELVIESTTSPSSTITGRQTAQISGLKTLGVTRAEASLTTDMAPIHHWLRPNERPWTGQLDTLIRARREKDLWNLGLRLELRDLARLSTDDSPVGLGGNVVVGLSATYAPLSDRLELTEMGVKAPYVQIEGSGTVGDVTSHPRIDLKGLLSPDWAKLNDLLARKIEPNARIAGRPRDWHLSGTVPTLTTAAWPGSLEGDLGIGVDSIDVFGMRLAETSVVLRTKDGQLRIDPVDATLNGGVLHLEPELVFDKSGSTWIRLGRSSTLEGAVVNNEVSHRVLSFVAPVLDGATRVDGRISVELAEALLPVLASPEAQPRIEGDIVFDEVRFMPGPLADQLLSILQMSRKPLLVLRDSISVRIADGKVHQEGLIIPVGNVASIGLNGSVDFEKNLDLVARFAMVPPRSNTAVLTPIMKLARFDLPIRGTLNKPRIDGDALKERLKSFGTALLDNSLQVGVDSLQRLFQGLTMPSFRRPGRRPRQAAPSGQPALPPLPRSDPRVPRIGVPRDEDQVAETPPEARQPSGSQVQKMPDPPKPLTAEEPKRLRERKREQRLAKKAERRLQKGLPPE